MRHLGKRLKLFQGIVLIGIALMTLNFTVDNKMTDKMAQLSEKNALLYRFMKRQAKILGEKYHMQQAGAGLGGMDKLELMTLPFHRYGEPLTEKEARRLIINCVDDFLEAINKEDEIRPFLKEYPFTAKNVDLTILNFGERDCPHYFPFIANIWSSKGKIAFLTEHPLTKCGYYTEKYETYDESVAILKQENQDEKNALEKDQ